MFTRATAKALHKIPKSIDLLYAHFFYSAGLAAVRCARQMNIPVFVAHGDDSIEPWYLTKGKKHFRKVSGVVAVSSDNAHFCREMFGIPGSRIRMFPNGVDRTLFYPRDRNEARRRLHLPEGVPLVAFVGHFIPRKGPDRLLAALEGIDGVGALMIGEGPIGLSSTRIRFQGVVDHHELPWYLSAADLFVLPTTGEGSCNAILEAMACGLPIVSSDGSFNDDILTPEVALRVDPMDITALRQAVETLMKDPELRGSMGQRSLEWSANFRIEVRATCILDWMQALMKN
jgi:glycosyltransferase involved in cell wall biosynthesis